MPLPTFSAYLNESPHHGEVEHKALLQTHNMDMEDAPDHQTSGDERLSLLRKHEHAVNSHYHDMIQYTSNSRHLNHALITGTATTHQKGHHESLMEMHRKAPALHMDVHAYSSLGNFDPTDHIKDSGGSFHTPAHLSTSINPHVASAHSNFRHVLDGKKDQHVIHFHLPKGYKGGTYIGNYSNHPSEQEFLIQPHTKFKMTGSEKHDLGNGRTRTVWHASPHEEHLHETTYHDPDVFRGARHPRHPTDLGSKHASHVLISQEDNERDVDNQHNFMHNNHSMHWPEDESGDHHKQASAIYRYTSDSHWINKALVHAHAGAPVNDSVHNDAMKLSDHITAGIQHHAKPLHAETHVYSGIDVAHAEHLQHSVANGGLMHTPAFTSTSIDPTVSAPFAKAIKHDGETSHDKWRTKSDAHVLHFKLPKGYKKGIYTTGVSTASYEREYLLDKGQTWKVTGKKMIARTDAAKSDNVSIGHRITRRTHIWTLEPHDHKLQEATYHEPNVFRFNSSFDYKGKISDRREKASTRDVETHNAVRKDVDDHHDHMMKTAPRHSTRDPIDREHIRVLGEHTSSSMWVNKHLVDKHNFANVSNSEAEDRVGKVSKAIDHFARPLEQETHVYSGLKHKSPVEAHKNGGVFHLPAYTSTSLDPRTTYGFADTHGQADHKMTYTHNGKVHEHEYSKSDAHVIHFKLPKGYSKGAYLSGISEYPSEKEYLMDKGQSWKITGHKVTTTRNHSKGVPTHAFGPLSGYTQSNRTHVWTVEPHEHEPKPGKLQEVASPIANFTAHSRNLNHGLTADKVRPSIAKRAVNIENHMKPHTGDAMTVYHGTKDMGFEHGGTYTPKTFMSASHSADTGMRFAKAHGFESHHRGNESEGHLLHITVHPGVKTLSIGNDNSHFDEDELVINRNQPMRLEKMHSEVTTTGGKQITIHHWKASTAAHVNEAVEHHESFFNGTIAYDRVHGRNGVVSHTGKVGAFKTVDHAADHEALHKQHVSMRNSHKVVDVATQHIIHKYTGNSAKINSHLIMPKALSFLGADHGRHADLMSNAIKKHGKPLRHDVHVYSGLGNFDPTKHFDHTGTIHMPAFTSTSLNPTTALAFGPSNPRKNTTHVVHFHLPKGYKKSLYVAGHSAVKDEREMLLDRGQKWQLTGVKKSTVKIKYSSALSRHTGESSHHRDVTVWSVRPHHSQMTEAYTHDPDHEGFAAGGDVTDLDWGSPHSADNHHEEHLALHALHDSDHPDHVRHIENWSASTHMITQHLIKGKNIDADTKELHGHMQHLMATAKPLEREHHVYSSLGKFDPSKAANAEGHFTTPAYTCASLNPEIATLHANSHGADKTTHIAHFKLPAGYKGGRYIGGHSSIPHEHEMVLAPNQRWKKTDEIVHPTADGGERHIHSFEPADHHVHEALIHDPKLLHDAHPEGKSFKQQVAELPHDPEVDHQKNVHMGFLADKINRVKDYRMHLDTQAEAAHLEARATAHALIHDKHDHEGHVNTVSRSIFDNHTEEYKDARVNSAIHHYTEGSEDLNEHLVNLHDHGVGSPYADMHNNNAARLSKNIAACAAPLDKVHHMYSGMRTFNPSEHFKKNNGVIHMPAFTSASINPHIASNFSYPGKQTDHHVMHFELPVGYNKGAYIGHHSGHPHEQEFLLDKGQSWKLKKHEAVQTHDTTWGEGEIVKRHIWTVVPHEDK